MQIQSNSHRHRLTPATCEHCGKSFQARNDYHGEPQRFCSRGCAALGRKAKRETISCQQCGITMTVQPSRATRRYCGKPCAVKAQHGPKKLLEGCAECGQPFRKRATRPNPYCSYACFTAAKNRAQKETFPDRFWSMVDKSGECWLWNGPTGPGGYGSVHVPGKRSPQRAPRVAWELTNGVPIPRRMLICHHCDNPPCVRPDHLFMGTPLDNMRDMIAKGRAVRPKASSKPRH